VKLRSFSKENIWASLAVDALFFILRATFIFGFIQLEVQLLLQIDEVFEIFIIGLSKL